jgi:prolyl oligopeptidase
MNYPVSRKSDVVDVYGTTRIADPYRWLEDLDSPDVAAWVAAQNAVTFAHLEQLPHRDHLKRRLTELWDFSRTTLPVVERGRLFYTKNSGLQRQSPIYVRSGVADPPALVLDPNLLSPDGSISLAQYAPSPDARLVVYAVAQGGADWETLRIRNVATGEDLGDVISWVRFSELSWTHDSNGFFYSRYPEPPAGKVLEAALAHQAVYYHRVGTPQSEDVLVYQRLDHPAWIVNATVSEDGRYVFIRTFRGADNNNQLHFIHLGDPGRPVITAPIKPIVETIDAEFTPIGNYQTRVYLRSDKDAPNRRIIAIDLEHVEPDRWKVVVPEQPHAIENAALVGGRLVVHSLVDVQSRIQLFALDGTHEADVPLPGVGAVTDLYGRGDEYDLWFTFSSPLAPPTVYRYDLELRSRHPFEEPLPPIDASQFETRAMFATSPDGTRVPFFMTSKKGLPQDGRNPTMLYGYGGFSISVLPFYRPDVPAWLELGGVFVTVNLRGGAEYGEAWHKAGYREQKQNVFDDFIAVAEHLVREGYTSPGCLGIMGGSNGGLLVGAVMEQRPDLIAVAMPAVGVMDMLRYDRFTGGKLWATEYGSSSDPRQFAFLIKYSPLHNVRAGTCYPATLVTTADHDDRVVPSHSFKFTAALQAAQACERPVLIRVETRGSHGYRPTDRLIAERADQWAFAAAHLGARPLP